MVFSWHFSAHIHCPNVFACLKLKKNKCHILCKHPNLSFGWFGPGAGWTSHTAYCSPRRHAYAKWDFQYLERMATNSTLYGDWNWARNMRQICSIALVLMPAIWLDEALTQMTIYRRMPHTLPLPLFPMDWPFVYIRKLCLFIFSVLQCFYFCWLRVEGKIHLTTLGCCCDNSCG